MEVSMLKVIWDMLLSSDLFTKFILLTIIIVSVYSWAIIYKKFRRFSLIRNQSKKIIDYAKGKNALNLLKANVKVTDHPLARMMLVLKESMFSTPEIPDTLILHEEVNATITQILEYEERHIDFLATTSTVSPFLGLLGTVWGITGSFSAISQQASANITVVAGGLSGALITTIFGIVAAIPAFFAFNYFRSELRHIEGELESFSKTTMARAIRERTLQNAGQNVEGR